MIRRLHGVVQSAMLAVFPSREKGKGAARAMRCAALAALFLLALPGWPVERLVALDRETPLIAAPIPLGRGFETRYIHSVQRTPVEDEYRVLGGRIWSWRERVQSHNAGLPFAPPALGRFYQEPPWMIIEGGRYAWEHLYLRVGNETFGRNEFSLTGGKSLPLYRLFPGKRLDFTVERLPLLRAFPALWTSAAP